MAKVEASQLFGRIALKKGFLDEDRLAEAVRYQEEIRSLGLDRPLGEILIDEGVLSEEQVQLVLRLQALNQRARLEKSFGRIAVKNKLISESEMEAALARAREDGFQHSLGDILVGRGLLAPSQARAVQRVLDRRAGKAQAATADDEAQRSATGRLAEVLSEGAEDEEARASEQRVQDAIFAAVAVREGLLLVPELERALHQQEQDLRDGVAHSLVEVLEERGILGPRDVAAVQAALDTSRAEKLVIPGYQLLDVMGHGRTSIVLRARHELIQREVAIKLFRAEHMAATEADTLIAEARTIAKIQHPNVTGLFEVGRVHRRIYYAMELVDGPTLHELIRAGGNVVEREALQIALDVVRGLEAIEAAGMVHRDVKPRNIVITPEGKAKLTDLGLARPQGADDEGGRAIYGTPHTISPEQVHGDPVDIRADLYGLGATLYWALTGQPPFDGKQPLEVMLAHATAPVPDPRALAPGITPETAALVTRLLAKEREQRPASARAAGEAIEVILAFSGGPPAA